MAIEIPGSEKFASRGGTLTHDDIAWPEGLRPHTVSQAEVDAIDPLTYEVVRHRLAAITTEMGDALRRMSGSLIVSEINDFNVALLDELGDVVQFGLYNVHLSAAGSLAVKWTLQNRAINPGIRPGDMFITTDPWVGGGLHQNDVCLMAPIFVDDELFAWAVSIAHQVDVGGVAPGSWSTLGQDVFWESLPLPPIRIVEGGQLREDIEDSYLRRSRVPALEGLDLRAKIGSNNIAVQRTNELAARYGTDTVKAVMRRLMDDSESRLRARLRTFPDGEWTSVAYQDSAREGDRNVYRIRCRMTKKGDTLTFDFTGTDPQADGFINCTYGGLTAGVIVGVLPTLCGDIPWSAGIWRAIELISEPGTMNDATFPAGVGKASVASSFATQSATIECISGMLDAADAEYDRQNLIAVPCGGWDLAIIAGRDQYERPFVAMIGDAMAAGGGASGTQDGGDTSGLIGIVRGKIADVEMNEFQYPVLYLWRREEADSGGAGRFRGGVGGSSCFLIYGAPDPAVALVVSQSGKALPQPTGVSGGRSGNTGYDVIVRGSDAASQFASGVVPSRLDAIGGEHLEMPQHLTTYLGQGDAYFMQWQGGGGYGDPTNRDPDLVRADVAAGKVTAEAGADLYGVVLDNGEVDAEATSQRRVELRGVAATDAVAVPGRRLDDNLVVRADGQVACRHCATSLGSPDGYLERAALVVSERESAGPQLLGNAGIGIDAEIVFRDYRCPGCGVSLHNEVVPAADGLYRSRRLLTERPKG